MLNLLASRKSLVAFGLLASTSLVLPACSTMGSITSGFGGDPYLSDSSDACYANRQALAATEDHFAKDLVAGALSGAAVGAAMGAATGAISGGDVGKAALIGAGTGLLAGLAGGYLVSLQKKQQEPTEMVRLAMADMEAESAAIDRTTIAFDNLVECRGRQAAQINRDLKAGAIDRTTAEQRMATINQQYQEDLAKARGISSKVNERSDAFLQVSNTIAADSGQKQLEIQKRGPGRAAKVAKVERPTTGAAVKSDELTPIAVDKELVAKQQNITESTIDAGIKFEDKIQTAEAQPPFAIL